MARYRVIFISASFFLGSWVLHAMQPLLKTAIDSKQAATLLFTGIKEGNTKKIETALAHNVDICVQDEDGCTALHWAIFHNNGYVLDLILNFFSEKQLQSKLSMSLQEAVAIQPKKFVKLATLSHTYSKHLSVKKPLFSSDGNRLLTIHNNTAIVWDLEGRKSISLDHNEEISLVMFAIDNTRILTVSGSTAQIWDLEATVLASMSHKGKIICASFSTDGTKILTGSTDGVATLWDFYGKELVSIKIPCDAENISFSASQDSIVITSPLRLEKKQLLMFYDLKGKELKQDKLNHGPHSPKYYINSERLVYFDAKTVFLCDFQGKVLATCIHENPVQQAMAGPGANTILTISNGKAYLWDTYGSLIATLTHDIPLLSAIFSSLKNYILTTSSDNTVILWDQTGTKLIIMKHPSSQGGTFHNGSGFVSPFGNYILTLSAFPRNALLWDFKGNNIASFLTDGSPFDSTHAFSPDHQRLVIREESKSIESTYSLYCLPGTPLDWSIAQAACSGDTLS